MDEIRVLSANIRNNLKIDKKKNTELAKIFKKYDIVGTQEFTYFNLKQVRKILEKNNYQTYGKYRYGNLFKLYPGNETNSIITNKPIILAETYHLPFLSSDLLINIKQITHFALFPRVATVTLFESNNYNHFCMINTHLDFFSSKIRRKQLEVLAKIIKEYSTYYPIILTGDFNCGYGNLEFDGFCNEMANYIHCINIGNYNSEYKINNVDYIFISHDFEVVEAGTLDGKNLSDHNFLYAVLKK